MGVIRSTYVSFETGNARISLNAALALRDTYGLSLDLLYCGDLDGLSSDVRIAWLRV